MSMAGSEPSEREWVDFVVTEARLLDDKRKGPRACSRQPHLVRDGSSLRLRLKRVDLPNGEAALPVVQLSI